MSETENRQPKNIKNNPKIMKAWAVYDWANSVYSLVITSTIFLFIIPFLPQRMKRKNM
jgi:UMF1 family MFS transporter